MTQEVQAQDTVPFQDNLEKMAYAVAEYNRAEQKANALAVTFKNFMAVYVELLAGTNPTLTPEVFANTMQMYYRHYGAEESRTFATEAQAEGSQEAARRMLEIIGETPKN